MSNSKSVDQIAGGLESLDFGTTPKAMNNDDIMALYNRPQPQMFMSMQQQPGFSPFGMPPAAQNWTADSFMAPNLSSPPAIQHPPPPQQNKSASSAFDDLFATATAHFSSTTPPNRSVPVTAPPSTNTPAAHQDLESLFM
jgi:hypothetical protein